MLQDQWFVVVTNSQRENFVAEQLKDNDPYLPRFKNSKGRLAPLFPGYLFVPQVSHWGPICSTVGVRALIMAGDHPARLSGKVINGWKAKERGGVVQLPPPPRFALGEKLTITRGSLKHRSVVYAGMSGRDRERVLIAMLGQHVTIIVPTADLVSEFGRPTRNSLPRHRKQVYGQREHSAA